MDHRHVAALSGNRLIVHNGIPRERLLTPAQLRPAARLVEYCAAENIRAVWMLDAGLDAWGAYEEPPSGWRVHASRPQGAERATVYRYRPWSDPEGRRAITLYHHDPRWGWAAINEPGAYLASVTAYEAAIGMPTGYSPASMALDLLAETNRKHPDWLAYERGDAPLAQDRAPLWSRPIPRAYARESRLWLWDVNAAYLAAAQGMAFGAGCPTPARALSLAERAPLIGQLEAVAPVSAAPRPAPRRGWYDRGTLASLRLAGQPATLGAIWTWREHHAAMRAWAERLWTARESLPPGPARDTIKLAYTTIWGVMNRPESPRHYRPHWVSAVVAEQARRRYGDYARLTAMGLDVVLLRVDTLGIVGGEAGAAAAETALRMGGLGGYKRLGSAPITNDLLGLARRGDVGGMVRYVEQEGEHGGHGA